VQLVLHDRGALLSLFLLPLIFVAVFGSMFGGSKEDGEGRLIAVHYAGSNPRAARAVGALEASPAFRIARKDSADAVRSMVAGEKVRAGIVFPSHFDPTAGVPAELSIDEGMALRVRGPLEGALSGIIGAALDNRAAPRRGPVLVPRTPPGIKAPLKNIDGFQVSVPGNAVLFGFFLALTVALSFTEERTSGTWRRLLAAPVSRPALVLAKLVPYFVIGLVQMAFLFGLGALAFNMKVAGSVVGLCLLTCAVVFCAVALGLLIASFSGTQKQVGSIGSIAILLMGLLGGAMIPRLIMPETMQHIGLATPHAWALEGYYDILVREGTGVADIVRPLGAVLGFGVLFAAVGAARFRFER
jgi:ABC-type multidrug transport system permease subunit